MKHVCITGGSDGLGKYLATELVQQGYAITILGRDEHKIGHVAYEIGCEYMVVDVTNFDALIEAFTNVSQPIDILINNAGIWVEGPFETMSKEDILDGIMVNTVGVMFCTRIVLPQMLARKAGEIINISSRAGLVHRPDRGVYGTSKWAVTGFTYNLRDELAPKGIKVTGIYPATFDTKLFEKAGAERDMTNALSVSEVGDRIIEHIITNASSEDIQITK